MRFLLLLEVTYKLRLLTPAGLWRLLSAIVRHGINVMALLRIAERTHGDSPAIVDDRGSVSYRELLSQANRLASLLTSRHGVKRGMKIGLIGRNKLALVRSIFAVSATGADLYMMNAELSPSQLKELAAYNELDLILYDDIRALDIETSKPSKQRGWAIASLASLDWQLLTAGETPSLPRSSSGRIMLLTGGTTGRPKGVAHKPSLLHYLPPFAALLNRLPLLGCRTVYIATPMAHGFGLANLFLFVALGYKLILTPRFKAEDACALIREHGVEVTIVVPLMVKRMLGHDSGALASLRCIVSGGAALSGKLAMETMNTLGEVLFNLYGTTEGGLTTIATPRDMRRIPGTIGKAIRGVPLYVLSESGRLGRDGEVGRLCIRRGKGLPGQRASWIETGDVGVRESSGLYRLMGRIDDMIVSGGENVFPAEVEGILRQHPDVEDAIVIGIDDDAFGQRLAAFVELKKQADQSEESLMMWLRPRMARYQLPRSIVMMDELPYTPIGKPDLGALKN
ncbi:AMP-binding protein [Paenibacillus sp. PAMC21692]|uniref:AMP-binding protein n=1 Tax=Paenibacillus sp. PAMC21692 TaxID=2762320 RepID=UPI00164EAB8E|nr:AMP-binding protein [Paenibacillus sp. PAMC21692]QNK55693.1 AMP-binding protein [Paenibacillus sp. PAMC21692]